MGIPVAIDVTPLVGVRTGIGNAVAELIASFANLEAAPTLVPYALSLRAREHRSELPPDTRFPPIPARALLASWGRSDAPKLDFWLRPARVLHATNYLAPPSRLPVIVTINDCSFARYPELCTPEVRALPPVVRRSIRRGAVVHVPSAFVAAEVDDLFGPGLAGTGRLVVVPWGVPPVRTGSDTPPELRAIVDGSPYVLAIGSLEPRKNLPYLVAAFGAVADSHPDLRLVLAGPDGPARPAVDAAIAELDASIRSRVVITGGVSDAGRVALLAHAHVLAYPSLYEGFGFPVLEAMSIGVPGRRRARRLDPRGRGRRRDARRRDRRARARRRAHRARRRRREARRAGGVGSRPGPAVLVARDRARPRGPLPAPGQLVEGA